MSAVVEAEKLAACEPQSSFAANQAISIRASWEAVVAVEGITVPLRRPKRKITTGHSPSDGGAAIAALMESSDDDVSYEEFRKGLDL